MKRREATGWILKSAVFTPGLVGFIQSCQQKVSENIELLVLDEELFQLGKAIADTILPKTDTPSASEVKVMEVIDLLLRDVFEKDVVDSFKQGLQQFDKDCTNAQGKSFTRLTQEQQNQYLSSVDNEVMTGDYDDAVPFYYTFKNLCVEVYFQTEQGVKQNLDYQPIPGPYVGDVELKPGDKIMRGNSM